MIPDESKLSHQAMYVKDFDFFSNSYWIKKTIKMIKDETRVFFPVCADEAKNSAAHKWNLGE